MPVAAGVCVMSCRRARALGVTRMQAVPQPSWGGCIVCGTAPSHPQVMRHGGHTHTPRHELSCPACHSCGAAPRLEQGSYWKFRLGIHTCMGFACQCLGHAHGVCLCHCTLALPGFPCVGSRLVLVPPVTVFVLTVLLLLFSSCVMTRSCAPMYRKFIVL